MFSVHKMEEENHFHVLKSAASLSVEEFDGMDGMDGATGGDKLNNPKSE